MPNGRGYVLGGTEGRVSIVDFASAEKSYQFRCHRLTLPGQKLPTAINMVNALDFCPSGPLLTGGGDGEVISWDLDAKAKLACVASIPFAVTAMRASPDGSQVAVASGDDLGQVFDNPFNPSAEVQIVAMDPEKVTMKSAQFNQ